MKSKSFSLMMAFSMVACLGRTDPNQDLCPGSNNVSLHSDHGTLSSPQISLIFWGNVYYNIDLPIGRRTLVLTGIDSMVNIKNNEWSRLINDPAFYAPVSEYGITPGTFAGSFLENSTLAPGVILASDIEVQLDLEIANGYLPKSNSHTLYVVLLPSTTQSSFDLPPTPGAGYHSYHQGYTYAVIEWMSDQTSISNTIAHEIYEAMTESIPSHGWYDNSSGYEIADICQSANNWQLDNVLLPRVWSQEQCRCVP